MKSYYSRLSASWPIGATWICDASDGITNRRNALGRLVTSSRVTTDDGRLNGVLEVEVIIVIAALVASVVASEVVWSQAMADARNDRR